MYPYDIMMEYTLQTQVYKQDVIYIVFCPLPKAGRIPSQVTGLSLSKTVSSKFPALQATWTIPQSDEPISKYIIRYRIHGNTTRGSQRTIYLSGSPPPNSTIVTRLAAGTEYNVRVRAMSAGGRGKWSAVQTERTYISEFFSMITNNLCISQATIE